jgi:hypothetical protein
MSAPSASTMTDSQSHPVGAELFPFFTSRRRRQKNLNTRSISEYDLAKLFGKFRSEQLHPYQINALASV